MNLAILIGRFPPGALGGAEHQAECWAARLADRHRVTVVTRRETPGPETRERRDGFDVIRLPVSRIPMWRALRDVSGIERVVASLDPRPDALLCFQTFVSGFAGVRIQQHHGIPALVWIRGEGEYRGAHSAARWVAPQVWRDARAVLIQTESGRTELLHELEWRSSALRATVEAKLAVVPNGLDLPLPERIAAPGPGARVLAVGRLIPDKGMDVAIDALAPGRTPLTLAGSGPERARLETRARRLGADVRFEGFVGREALARLYQASSCFVLAARRGEGLPNVLLEAMSWGLPVVATSVAGVRELVRHEINGLLVPPDDAKALASAIGRVSREPVLAERLASGARATAEEYAWDRVRPRLEAQLERCVA